MIVQSIRQDIYLNFCSHKLIYAIIVQRSFVPFVHVVSELTKHVVIREKCGDENAYRNFKATIS